LSLFMEMVLFAEFASNQMMNLKRSIYN